MKKILLIATVYRVGERIYSTIPELSKFANIDVLLLNRMSPKCPWYGDDDPRITFHNSYDQYFGTIYDAGMHSTDANPSPILLDIDISQYDLLLYDDNRNRHGISNIYNKANPYDLKIIEDYSDLDATTVPDDIVEKASDTPSLLDTYIEETETALDKTRLKTLMKSLYTEAFDYE